MILANRPTLSTIQNLLKDSLRKDLISLLPTEVSHKIFNYLNYKSLLNASMVCKNWLNISESGYDFWRHFLFQNGLINSEIEFNNEFFSIKSQRPDLNNLDIAKFMYKRRHIIAKRWKDPSFNPRRITITGEGPNVVTCLQFDEDKIIAGSDDHSITIYDTATGKLRSVLDGHNGGVWAMKYYKNTLASGSTDRSVRIWNIKTGKCTHIFRGHTSTVRCLDILEPQQIGVDDEGNKIMFPERPLLVTGSRDSTLYVWELPLAPEDEEENNQEDGEAGNNDEPLDLDESHNKYLVRVLRGHTASVRAVSGHANILVSISYDTNARVWDLKTGECKWLLQGHTDRIYSCVLDVERNRCISGSVDNTVRQQQMQQFVFGILKLD
ncbi:unnamed protein product [[Candida] boidinii]|nr:unnamed protein product [[Candida] boidinii]